MTEWRRALWAVRCGGCNAPIAAGSPVLVLVVAGRREKIRGVCCDGPAPPDLPAVVLERDPPKPFVMTRFDPGMLPIDFKARQVEREPGEEG